MEAIFEEIKELIDEGSTEIAMRHLKQILDNPDYEKPPANYQTINLYAKVLRLNGKPKQSMNELNRIIDSINPHMYPLQKLDVMVEYCYDLFNLNQFDELELLIDQVREFFNTLPNSIKNNAVVSYATLFHIQGITAIRKGDLDKGLQFLIKGREIRKKYNLTRDLAYSEFNIGLVYHTRTDYEKADKCYNNALNLFIELGNTTELSFVLANLGTLNIIRGNPKGKDLLYEAVKNSQKLNNQQYLSEPLFELSYALLQEGKINEAKKYIDQIQTLIENHDDKSAKLRYDLISALYYKFQPRLVDKAKAQRLLEQIMTQTNIELKYQIITIKHYSELLIDELRLAIRQDIIDELKVNIDILFNIGLKYSIVNLILEALILQTKIAIISGNLKDASELITETKKIAERENKFDYLKEIESEEEFLKFVIHNYGLVGSQDISRDSANEMQFNEYLREAQTFITRYSDKNHLQ